MTNPTSNPLAEFIRPSVSDAVANHLRELIARGVFVNRLPGERVLAEQLKVGRPSVRLALEILAKEGLIERGQGKPTRLPVPVSTGANAA